MRFTMLLSLHALTEMCTSEYGLNNKPLQPLPEFSHMAAAMFIS